VLLVAAAALAALGTSLLALVACGSGGGAAPQEDRLLVIDGIVIRLADVEPYVAYIASYLPEGGRKTMIQNVLDEHVIPLRIAQRAFPEQRRVQKERADAICSVAKNWEELEKVTAQIAEKKRSIVVRTAARLPVGIYAFDPLHTGSVSPPLEVPEGWFIAGVYDVMEAPAQMINDRIDVLQVGCVTHTSREWRDFYEAEKQRLADKATFVHPDYVHAMPAWIRQEKKS
jgi:hypothetical protein